MATRTLLYPSRASCALKKPAAVKWFEWLGLALVVCALVGIIGYGAFQGLAARPEEVRAEKAPLALVKHRVAGAGEHQGPRQTTGSDDDDHDEHKSKIVGWTAGADNKVYYVASDLPGKAYAANLMAEITGRTQKLLHVISSQLSAHKRIKAKDGVDITDNMKQLVRKHYKKPIPLAEYHNPRNKTIGRNNRKGELVELCLRSKFDSSEWNSVNTLFRVMCHELAHSADFEFRDRGEEAHGPVFKRLHQYLLSVSEANGMYSCAEYKRSGRKICGLKLGEEYCG